MDNSDGTLSIEPDINADGLFTIPVSVVMVRQSIQ